MDIFNATNQPVEITAEGVKILIGPSTVGAIGELVGWVRRKMVDTDLGDPGRLSMAELRLRHKLAWETASTVDMGTRLFNNEMASISGLAKWLQVHATLATPNEPMDYDAAFQAMTAMDADEVTAFYLAKEQVNTPAHPTEPETAKKPKD